MLPLLLILCCSFAAGLVLTRVVRALALRCDLVDRPDGWRKLHGKPVPVGGGMAILLAMALTLTLAEVLPNPLRGQLSGQGLSLPGLLAAATMICGLGVLDDFGRLRGRHKLVGQALVVCVVMLAGVHVQRVSLFGWDVELGLLAVPFTLFLLLGAINSLNLLDGMDGMLSSVGLVISLSMAVMAALGDHVPAACVALALAGALLAFLRYNFPPASIFLGDSGSMLIGLVIGVLAIQSSLKGPATVALAAPTALLIVPIFDTTAAILRRKLTGRSIYTTDRGHLHHCLQRHGLTRVRVLLLVSGLCLLTGAGALAGMLLKNEVVALLSAVAVVAILVLPRLFGHAELSLLGQRVQGLAASFVGGGNGDAAWGTEVRLQGSLDWSKLWTTILAWSEPLNLRTVCLDVNAPVISEGYHARLERPQPDLETSSFWQAEIPLVARGQVIGRLEVVGYQDGDTVSEKIAILAKLVQTFEKGALILTRGAWGSLPLGPAVENPHPDGRLATKTGVPL
jgi:UDP-GlcNAc:undecaprenyl-phosphate GlcNAc-1-phosphate transferase